MRLRVVDGDEVINAIERNYVKAFYLSLAAATDTKVFTRVVHVLNRGDSDDFDICKWDLVAV